MADFVLAYALYGSVILLIQVVGLLVLTFGIFGVSLYCHFIIYSLLTNVNLDRKNWKYFPVCSDLLVYWNDRYVALITSKAIIYNCFS